MRRVPVVFALPALVLWALFMAVPALWGIYISLTNEALVGPNAAHPRFVGLENYRRLLSDPLFWNSVEKSFVFVMGSAIIGQAGLGMLLAIFTTRKRVPRWLALLSKVAMAVCFLSWITPEAVIGMMWVCVLDMEGLLNQILRFLGFEPVGWLFRFPMTSIIIANIWWGTAWSMVLFRSAIESIPSEIEEAAMVDGASGWQRFLYIILPLLRGPILVNLILITIWTYGVFGLPLMLTGGGPAHRTELMTIYAYKTAFKYFEIGYGAAISVGILVITLGLSLIYRRILEAKG